MGICDYLLATVAETLTPQKKKDHMLDDTVEAPSNELSPRSNLCWNAVIHVLSRVCWDIRLFFKKENLKHFDRWGRFGNQMYTLC